MFPLHTGIIFSRSAQRAGLFAAALLGSAVLAAGQATAPLVFDPAPPTNDLQGSLAARVQFAQSQVVPAHGREEDPQPYLVGQRKCLLMVRPLKVDGATPVTVTVRDGQGKTLGTLTLDPPDKLPKTAYYVDGIPEKGVDFTPGAGSSLIIRSASDLEKLKDPSGSFLADNLKKNALVEIQTADGQWVSDFHFPKGTGLDGKMVRTRSRAGYKSTVHYSGKALTLARDQSFQFKCVAGQWIRDGELENNNLVYATDTWSGVLPPAWIVPGLALQVRQGALSGELKAKVGAPTELLIHTIDLGMLTTPRGAFAFAKDAEAHREYFQTVPTSRLIVSQYAPLALPEVMLPNGTLLKEFDPSEGAWHTGDLRQRIGKELISHGIDNANYGLHSTAGEGEKSHPYVVAQLAAHNSRGKYAKGDFVHGGSGGGGIVTLDSSIGNEFSHEVGHNYGLGHYPGGFKGSVHRGPGEGNSTWGWDADKLRFLPNFFPTRTGQPACVEKQCQDPFAGHTYGSDPMAGGSPFSAFNRFTLYTPYSAALIQKFLETKAVFDASSPTGFSKWNDAAGRMEPYRHQVDLTGQGSVDRRPQAFGIPVTTLVGYYDPTGELKTTIYPALHGAYGFCYGDDGKSLKAGDCELQVETRGGVLRFQLASQRLDAKVMNKFHVNVPESSQPRSAAIVCNGRVLDKQPIAPVAEKLTYTVHGTPLAPVPAAPRSNAGTLR